MEVFFPRWKYVLEDGCHWCSQCRLLFAQHLHLFLVQWLHPQFSFVNTLLLSIYTWGEADSPSQFQGLGFWPRLRWDVLSSCPKWLVQGLAVFWAGPKKVNTWTFLEPPRREVCFLLWLESGSVWVWNFQGASVEGMQGQECEVGQRLSVRLMDVPGLTLHVSLDFPCLGANACFPLPHCHFLSLSSATKKVLIPRIKAQEERQEILHLLFFSFTFFLLALAISTSWRSTIYFLLA